MKRLADRPNLDHLKKQAKDLLTLYKSGDGAAIARFRNALPAASNENDVGIANLGLRLHDAQSCVAREYGFPSWPDLKSYVEARVAHNSGRTPSSLELLRLVYAADIAGGANRARPHAAARMLEEGAAPARDDPYLACAIGEEAVLRQVTRDDPAWVDRPGGPLNLPPLVAVTHSSLLRLPEFRDRLHKSARLL